MSITTTLRSASIDKHRADDSAVAIVAQFVALLDHPPKAAEQGIDITFLPAVKLPTEIARLVHALQSDSRALADFLKGTMPLSEAAVAWNLLPAAILARPRRGS
jgi:hypothetical protein